MAQQKLQLFHRKICLWHRKMTIMAQKNDNGTEKYNHGTEKMTMAQAPVWRRGDLMVTTDNQKRNRFVLYYIGIIFALYW